MEIKLSNSEDVALVDEADISLVVGRSWSRTPDGYAISKGVLMHRLINDTPKGFETDHINHNTLDNRKSNLRSCTHAENMKNHKKKASVHFDKSRGTWMVRAKQDNGKRKFMGRFLTKQQATKMIGA